jgi:hypothetical protein
MRATHRPRRQAKRTNRAIRAAAVALLIGAILLAGVATPAAARPAADAQRPVDVASPDARRSADRYHATIAVNLSGIGIGPDNSTYDVVLEGKGRLRLASTSDAPRAVVGVLRLNGTITDENGTVVKQSEAFLAKIRAMQSAE